MAIKRTLGICDLCSEFAENLRLACLEINGEEVDYRLLCDNCWELSDPCTEREPSQSRAGGQT